MGLIDDLIKEEWFKTPRIIKAFSRIKRADFLPEDMKDLAEENTALPIGFGQTISQPQVVAFMLELLQPGAGEKILDIGAGSGWTTALLAEIVGEKGKVFALEVIPELKEFGERNVSKYGFISKGTAEFLCIDGSKGLENRAPFDKILVSATLAAAKGGKEDLSSLTAAVKLPEAWKKQLRIDGRIVVPINSSIWLFIKKKEEKGDEPKAHLHSASRSFVFKEKEYPGFVFVPLVEK